MRFHHIGVLTNSIDTAAHGAPIVDDKVWGIRSALQCIGDLQVEMIGPIEMGSWIRQALTRGIIVHHLGLEVEDAEQALQRLRNSGWFIVHQPRLTALWKAKSAFVMSPDRIPVELVEIPR